MLAWRAARPGVIGFLIVGVFEKMSDQDKNRSFDLRICRSLAEVEETLRDYEEATSSKFVSYHKDKQFGNELWQPSLKTRLYWKSDDGKTSAPVAYDGIPFMFIGRRVLSCHQGRDTSKAKKEKYAAERYRKQVEDNIYIKQRRTVPTKKVECQAVVYITQIMKFPDFKVFEEFEPTEVLRKTVSRNVKQALSENPESVKLEILYYVRLPGISEHSGHTVQDETAGRKEPIDQRIIREIMDCTNQGIKNSNEMKQHIINFVANTLFKGKPCPSLTRRRYYPKDSDIRNYMRKAKLAKCHSRAEEEQIDALITRWKEKLPDDNFMFSSYFVKSDSSNSHSLLFCYQSKWQRKLLQRYGRHLCVLDSAYRTIQFPLPLYFLLIRTNVEYMIVAVFIVQHEKKESVLKALTILKEWNPNWKPRNFIVDYNLSDMQAIQETWPDVNLKISDYHRESVWNKWCFKKEHGVKKYKEEILLAIQRIAETTTAADFESEVETFLESRWWRSSRSLQIWFSSKWLKENKKWVDAFQDPMLLISLKCNSGIEMLNEMLNYSFLSELRDMSLSTMITALISNVFPDSFSKYKAVNVRYSAGYPQDAAVIPQFLLNKPWSLADHILERMMSNISFTSIQQLPTNSFLVQGGDSSYHVQFGQDDILPSCTCQNWQFHKLPCEHFCAVFTYVKDYSWEQLCPMYRNNPLFVIDHDVYSDKNETADIYLEKDNEISQVIDSLFGCNTQVVTLSGRKNSRTHALTKKCTNKLQEIMKFTSVLQDENYLSDLEKTFDEILIQVKVQATTEGVDLLSTPKKRKLPNNTINTKKRQRISSDDENSTNIIHIDQIVQQEMTEAVSQVEQSVEEIPNEGITHVEHFIIPETNEEGLDDKKKYEDEIVKAEEAAEVVESCEVDDGTVSYEIIEAFSEDQCEIQQIIVIQPGEEFCIDNSAVLAEGVTLQVADHTYS